MNTEKHTTSQRPSLSPSPTSPKVPQEYIFFNASDIDDFTCNSSQQHVLGACTTSHCGLTALARCLLTRHESLHGTAVSTVSAKPQCACHAEASSSAAVVEGPRATRTRATVRGGLRCALGVTCMAVLIRHDVVAFRCTCKSRCGALGLRRQRHQRSHPARCFGKHPDATRNDHKRVRLTELPGAERDEAAGHAYPAGLCVRRPQETCAQVHWIRGHRLART